MRRMIWLYRRGLGAHLRTKLEYEADFWILLVAGLLSQASGIFFISAIFAKVPTLNGWRYEEIVFIYGLAGFAAGLTPILCDGIWSLGYLIHNGELDYKLIRPYPPVLQVMSGALGMNGIGDTLGAAILLVWALTRIDVPWSAMTVLIGLVLLVGAAVIRCAIVVASNAAQFWLGSRHPMFAQSLYQVGELTKYPLTIYSVAIKVLLAGVVPFAFASFFPATWVLDKGGYAWLGLLTPVVAIACALAAGRIFQLGLRRYDSAGH